MKNKLICGLLIGIISLSFVGCDDGDVINTNNTNNMTQTQNIKNEFIDTGDKYDIGLYYHVYYNNKTNIVYLVNTSGYGSGATVLYNSKKQPMTIDEYNKTKSQTSNRFIDTGNKYDIGLTYHVYFDSKTNIIYFVNTSGYGSGIMVMHNTKGEPMTLDEFNAIHK